jgi:signal transduction histidine kinase
VLYWIADVQHVAKIYDQAEVDAVRSLKMFQELEKSDRVLDNIWGVYNLLAIIASDLEDYDQAIAYYNKSMEYSDKIADAELNKSYSLNNIANAYRNKGDYNRALEILNELKSNRKAYEDFDPAFYGTILNNIALTLMKTDDYSQEDVEQKLRKAREIAYEYEDENGKLMSNLDLSQFFLETSRKDSVQKYAEAALQLANDFSSNEAKQRALYLLSEVTPGETGKNYLKEHIRLGDSLDIEERAVRNKIARIKFDTEQLKARNEQISKENLYLLIVLITLLASGVFLFIIVSQRARNKELKLKQVQQEANEEIYNLMLRQQDKIEEARASEKIRVSKELHDGILGRLFGVRLSLDSLNYTDGKDAVLNRVRYVEQLKKIEEDIRTISHEMNTDFVAGSGFADLLQELVDTQSEAYKLEAEFSVSNTINWDKVSNKIKINLYRIVQESMQNIYKHADATMMQIAISLINNDICLSVTDNGKGFEISKQKKGIGIKNVTSRVAEVNGQIEFKSQTGKGTTVKVLIPWQHL